MATGRSNQLTKQVGEYLVAAELGRLGLIASTFAGSVPDYGIIATDSEFVSVPVQVKTITGTSWQFDVRRFVQVDLDGKRQVIGQPSELRNDIVYVMVALSRYGSDRFYVLSMTDLQELLIDAHRAYLAKHDGIRPRKHDSFHCAINEKHLAPFKDQWLEEFQRKRGMQVNLSA